MPRPLRPSYGPAAEATSLQAMGHITLRVLNLTASLAFYDAIMPRMPRPSLGFPGAWYSLRMLTDPDDGGKRPELHLIEDANFWEPNHAGPSGLHRRYSRSGAHGMHAAMPVRCMGCARTLLSRLGVRVSLSVPRPDGVVQLYFGEDPDGFWWELIGAMEHAPEVRWRDPPGAWPLLPQRSSPSASPLPSSASSQGVGGAVASGNPLVSMVVEKVLRAGGSAADGAVAAAAVLGVVEPYNGGLGGDVYALVADPMAAVFHGKDVSALVASGRVPAISPSPATLRKVLDARELRHVPTTGPLAALTTPGGVAGWCALHLRHGRLAWRDVLRPAIDLARAGFTLSQRTAEAWGAGVREVIASSRAGHGLSEKALHDFFNTFAPLMAASTDAASNGSAILPSPPLAGDRVTNTALAGALTRLSTGGCADFYSNGGPIDLAMRHAHKHGSLVEFDPSDDEWRPSWEPTLSSSFRIDLGNGCERVRVHAPGPSSQAAAALPILQAMEHLGHLSPSCRRGRQPAAERPNASTLLAHLLSSKRLVYNEVRARQLGGLADPKALQAALSSGKWGRAIAAAADAAYRSGKPVGVQQRPYATPRLGSDGGDTEAVVVADADGLVVTLAQSLGGLFGSGLVDPSLGFALQVCMCARLCMCSGVQGTHACTVPQHGMHITCTRGDGDSRVP